MPCDDPRKRPDFIAYDVRPWDAASHNRTVPRAPSAAGRVKGWGSRVHRRICGASPDHIQNNARRSQGGSQALAESHSRERSGGEGPLRTGPTLTRCASSGTTSGTCVHGSHATVHPARPREDRAANRCRGRSDHTRGSPGSRCACAGVRELRRARRARRDRSTRADHCREGIHVAHRGTASAEKVLRELQPDYGSNTRDAEHDVVGRGDHL